VAFLEESLMSQLLLFRTEREWEQFHTPKNLSAALCVEAAELLECFQWAREGDLQEIVERDKQAIHDEIADVAIILSYLCHDLNVSVDDVVRRKLEKNREKYPVEKARGTARKYDCL
jgi:NTP pyrophosphatase (non-canonical NTP hydrolase)